MPPRDNTEIPRANIGIIDEWTTHQDRHWIDDLLRNIHIEPTPEREVQETQERVYEFAGWGRNKSNSDA